MLHDLRRKNGIALIMLALLLTIFPVPVLGAEEAEVNIPVSVTGASCTAAIFDAEGNELETLALAGGEAKDFTLTCTGLDTLKYTVALKDEDTDTITYDKTVYEIEVDLYYTEEGEISYAIAAGPAGTSVEEKVEVLTFKNVIHCMDDPPIEKKIMGNPKNKSTFTFVLTPNDPSFPMPPGGEDGELVTTVEGEGDVEFGNMNFSAPGIYEYTAAERDTGIDGYIFDTTVYTVRYTVTEQDGRLVSKRTFLQNGRESENQEAVVFVNTYTGDDSEDKGSDGRDDKGSDDKKSDDKNSGGTPSTGDTTDLMLWIVLAGVSVVGLLFARRARRD